MATTTNKHKPELIAEKYKINCVYEKKMFVSGFFGFISTDYRDVLVSYDEEEVWKCKRCGRIPEHEIHSG